MNIGPATLSFKQLVIGLMVLITPSVRALEPQTLFNFQVSPGTVTGTLVQGPDGNFYGTTAHGGPTGSGTVFRVTPAGTLTILVSDQANPAPGLVTGRDGLLYGMTEAGGGASGFGSVFKMTTDGALTNIAILDGVNAGNPQSGLVLAGDGNFYGASQEGGSNSVGAAFRVTPGGVVTTLVSFDFAALGGAPVAGLALGADGGIYGMTTGGGSAGQGTIFKITTNGTFSTLYSFQGTDGFVHNARLAPGPDGKLYGTSRDGGTADLGMIFSITTNGIFNQVFSFNGTNGISPGSDLAVGADGQLYGTTQLGGSTASLGTVFKVTTNGVLTTLVTFTDPAISGPQAGLLLASDGNFYGCTATWIFKMTPDGVLTPLVSLIPLTGVHPESKLVLAPDGNFYGTTRDGGSNNAGTIFKVTLDGILTPVFSFAGTNGSAPQAGLVLGPDGNFYGTTTLGGPNLDGSVFRFSPNGTLTSLAFFDGTNGANPQCQLVAAADGSLYGATPELGPGGYGTIFRVTTNGMLTALASFNNTNGADPEDGVIAGADGNLYGTTSGGGDHDVGTVFRVTPGGQLTTLFSFNNTNGANPLGGLVQGADGIFYGTTAFGGTNLPFGTIFKISTNGIQTPMFYFNFTNGDNPSVKMILAPDGNLYGVTGFGGATRGNGGDTGLGTVFRITTNSVFTTLVLFQGTNGSNPDAPLVVGPDGNLYGTTAQGGSGGGGTIFRIVLTPKFSGLQRLSDGRVFVTGTGPASGAYRLWSTSDLSLPITSWTLLTNDVLAADGSFSYTDSRPGTVSARFYRISIP